MRIFLATSEVPPTHSGMARVAERLTEGFRARGHDVDVFAADHLRRFALGDIRIPALLPRWKQFHQRASAADVVSLHGPVPAFSDLSLMRAGALPPVVTTHHMDVRFRKAAPLTALYRAAYHRLLARSQAVIVSTRATAKSLPRRLAPRTHVVPFGVDHERVVPRTTGSLDFSVLFVGQLRPYKGVDVLLRAMERLPGVRLRIAGAGYAGQRLQREAAGRGLGNVEFLGAIDDDELWRQYAAADVFVLPSLEMEYFGLATLEAMASGCVPVVSDLPGPVELVGDAGLVVPRGDDAALARAISELRDSAAQRRLLSDRARQRAAGFTWDRCIEAHLAIYGAACGQLSPPAPLESVGA